MRKQVRVSGTGSLCYGLERRSYWGFFDAFDNLDAPVFMPAGSCLKIEPDGEVPIVAIKVVMRGGIW